MKLTIILLLLTFSAVGCDYIRQKDMEEKAIQEKKKAELEYQKIKKKLEQEQPGKANKKN